MGLGRPERLRAISRGTSKELRHVNHPSVQPDGYRHLEDLSDTETMQDLRGPQRDIPKGARGDGSNWGKRFEAGATQDADGIAIRSFHGHSSKSGVWDDVLPVSRNMNLVVYGTTLQAAKSIVSNGLSRKEGIRIHFYACDLDGRPLGRTARI